MAEKQELVCEGCQKTLRIPEKYWGKKVRCPQCSHVLRVPAAPPAPEEAVLDDVEFIEEEEPFVGDSPMPTRICSRIFRRQASPHRHGSGVRSRNGNERRGDRGILQATKAAAHSLWNQGC